MDRRTFIGTVAGLINTRLYPNRINQLRFGLFHPVNPVALPFKRDHIARPQRQC